MEHNHDLWMEQLGADWMAHYALEDALNEIEEISEKISKLEDQDGDPLDKLSELSNAFQRRSAAFEKFGRAVYQLLEK